MSISKLESLPNEILTDILEKYINGIDIIKAFAFQLNRRFDALIAQSRRFWFDFMRCHKDDFRFCIGLLPAYINRIEELALSEQNTPGQIYAFLSFYPSFDVFKQLRRLYFHVNEEALEPGVAERALYRLSETTLNTLSIKITKAQSLFLFGDLVVKLFRMETLKKLSIDWNYYGLDWKSLYGVSSNIEYLTIRGMVCRSVDLKHIFQCAPNLKYLNIRIAIIKYADDYESQLSSEQSLTQMSTLRTVIFNVGEEDDPISHSQLEPFLRCMPSLHRLKIKMRGRLQDVSVWETLLQSSAPSLTYFVLECTMYRSTDPNVLNLLASIQTSFWIEKQNFHIVIKEFIYWDRDPFARMSLEDLTQDNSNEPVVKWWIGPQRKLDDNLSMLNKISVLYLSTESRSSLQHHYLDNVTQLMIDELNDNLFELIIAHVNCSRIKYLDVSFVKQSTNKISLLLSYTKNLISLRIKFNQLSDLQFGHLKQFNSIKFLDISADQHSFEKRNISAIGKIFPSIEHLMINTEDLRNIPMLQTYVPRLRSLTFRSTELNRISKFDDYDLRMFYHTLRRKAEFLFYRERNRITVWIDQCALQDSFWQENDPASSTQSSTNKSWPKKLMKKVSSFFN